LFNQFWQRRLAGSFEPQSPETFLCPQVSCRPKKMINKKMKLFLKNERTPVLPL